MCGERLQNKTWYTYHGSDKVWPEAKYGKKKKHEQKTIYQAQYCMTHKLDNKSVKL